MMISARCIAPGVGPAVALFVALLGNPSQMRTAGEWAECIVYLQDNVEILVAGTSSPSQCLENGKLCARERAYRQIIYFFRPILSGDLFEHCTSLDGH